MSQTLLLLTPGLPLILAALWCVRAARGVICVLAPWAVLPALVLALAGAPDSFIRVEWMLLGSQLGLGSLNRLFLGLTALLWLGAGIHARGYMRDDARQGRFYLLWLLTMAGNLGLIVAQDVASFYVFFALMTFAAYGLVIHEGGPKTLRAGRVYLVMAVLGEGLILSGLLVGSSHLSTPLTPMLNQLPGAIAGAGGQRNLIIACLFFGFGVKAGIPLLHMWLPLAHPVAPVPASAVLSGAMIKAGLFAWLSTLPLGLSVEQGWGVAVMLIGFVAAFGAALIGIQQHESKTVLAYSSISQMGLITVGVGAALYNPTLWWQLAPVLGLYAVHHGLSKGALFLGVSVARHPGPAGIRPWLWLALALPGLALCGWTASGATAKLGLKNVLSYGLGVGSAPAWWSALPTLLAVGAIGTTVLIARYLWLLHREAGTDRSDAQVWSGWLLVLIASLITVALLPVTALGGRWPTEAGALFDLAWPVMVGIVLSLLAWRYARPLTIAPGDILQPLTRLLIGLKSLISTGMQRLFPLLRLPRQAGDRIGTFFLGESGHSQALERFWRRDAALVMTALIVFMIVMLVWR